MNSKFRLVYIYLSLSEVFYFSMLTHYTFDASRQSTGQMTACLEVTVRHRFLDWEPSWLEWSFLCSSILYFAKGRGLLDPTSYFLKKRSMVWYFTTWLLLQCNCLICAPFGYKAQTAGIYVTVTNYYSLTVLRSTVEERNNWALKSLYVFVTFVLLLIIKHL